MPNLEVHFRNRSGETYNGGKMQDILKDFSWLGKSLQECVYNAYNGVNKCHLHNCHSVLVRFIEASEWDVGIDDLVFVIKCGQNGMSTKVQQEFCDIFDSSRVPSVGGLKLSDYLRQRGVSYSVELFNYCSHGFGKSPDRLDENKSYTF